MGGGNKLTLYTDSTSANLWVDQARTMTLMEAYDYDASALKAALINTDIIEVWNHHMDTRSIALSWKMDLADDTYQMTFTFSSYYPTLKTISFS